MKSTKSSMSRILITALLLINLPESNAQKNTIYLYPDSARYIINKNIYGHFAEHLGRCIYGGIWSGEDSEFENVNGINKAILDALCEIKIPNLRWPGGCFADSYHWYDGIGPQEDRPSTVNTFWGGTIENNHFGTHEYLDLCGELGAEPFICGNVGSGTVREMAEWVEYLNSNAPTPVTELRKENGKDTAWGVKFFNIGNESWGCGGVMTPEYYSNKLRNYGFFCKDFSGNQLFRIACGANGSDYNWTEVLMKEWQKMGQGRMKNYMQGLSLHHYSWGGTWENKFSAKEIDEYEWIYILSKNLEFETILEKHIEIMDKYDPEIKIALVVDEYGNWHDVEEGTNPRYLYQQNTIRDALSAGIYLNTMNNHAKRVKMANLAQMVNVLQALVLINKDNQIVKTPTYYLFKMYGVHHDAELIPTKIECENYEFGDIYLPTLNISASRNKDGYLHLTLLNLNPHKEVNIDCIIDGIGTVEFIEGQVLSGEKMDSFNDFGETEEVFIKSFNDLKVNANKLRVNLPSKSVVMLKLKETQNH